MKCMEMRDILHLQPTSWHEWINVEEFRRYLHPVSFDFRTYFISFCCLVQQQMLYDLPTPIGLSEIDLPLPSSEAEWNAESDDAWWILKTTDASPLNPHFQAAFDQLYKGVGDIPKPLYSELGGYIMISAILLAILDGYRLARVPTVAVDFGKFNTILDTWHKVWSADPKSERAEPSTGSSVAFNAAVIYRAAIVRRFRDYSK
jgi:hypothetical protein